MIKILDLFAGTQSVRKGLDKKFNIDEHIVYILDGNPQIHGYKTINGIKHKIYEYQGFDIYSPEEPNTILDLTKDTIVEEILKKLPKGWVPDFIWASPICNTFSMVNPGTGGNFYYIHDKSNDTIRVRDKDFGIGVSRNFKNKEKWTPKALKQKIDAAAIPALKMFQNTKEIINYFNVPFAIENPATALSRHILKEYTRNVVNYCMYGIDRKKPTAIYTNKPFNALKCNHKRKHSITHNMIHKSDERKKYKSDYAFRSAVPELLIIQILEEIGEL